MHVSPIALIKDMTPEELIERADILLFELAAPQISHARTLYLSTEYSQVQTEYLQQTGQPLPH